MTAELAGAALGLEIYDFDRMDPRAADPFNAPNLAGALGSALWLVAYVLIIRRCRADRAYGLPLLAICLNFGWELLASFALPVSSALWRTVYRAWLVGDAILVWQLLRHGRDLQTSPWVRRHFHAIVAIAFVLGVLGQYAFVVTYRDRQGIVAAFVGNLVMSVLFIPMYIARRGHRRGISVGAAWVKMVATALVTFQCLHLVQWLNPELSSVAFVAFLGAATFLFDAVYALMVSTRLFELEGRLDE